MPFAGLDLTGRKALVTGAARGIGATLAIGLAQAGADVAVTDMASDESWEGLSDVVMRIRNEGQVGLAGDLDVQDVPEIRPTIRRMAEDLGGLDILVNNAGIRRRAPRAGGHRGRLGRGYGYQPEGRFFLLAGGGAG